MRGKSQDKPFLKENRGNQLNNRYSLYLHNDEVNTFNYVIESLVEVCRHSGVQAEQCAMIAHYKGRSEVKNGNLEELQEMKAALAIRGLTATIEN
jgi:ATP-dependent Clp protease adaptor protein ClpS